MPFFPYSRKTHCHEDGTITIFDVRLQQWIKTNHPTEESLAALFPKERERVLKHLSSFLSNS